MGPGYREQGPWAPHPLGGWRELLCFLPQTHFLAVRPWMGYLPYLSFSLLIYKIRLGT